MNRFEEKYVNSVYDEIYKDFSNTRRHPWPIVKSFIHDLPEHSLVCDVGSGNGKNMFRNDLTYIATDLSEEMCKLSKEKADTTKSNVLALPFKDNTFDAVISIACIHHLSSEERRLKAIHECTRILKKNGKLLISVWSNSDKYGCGDQFIKWDNHPQKRYYHLFNKKELEDLCNFECEILYDKHNYYVHI